jgi:hypothetical protein
LFGDRPDIVLILQVGVVRLLLHTWLLPLLMETTITLDVPPYANTKQENEFQTRKISLISCAGPPSLITGGFHTRRTFINY